MRASGAQRLLRGMWGLRGRLIVTVVLAAALGATAAAWAGVRQSAASLIEANQRHHIEELVSRITQVAPSAQYPPDRDSLDRFRVAAGADSLVLFDEAMSGDGIFGAGAEPVPAGLHQAMNAQNDSGDARVLTQRVEIDGTPWLMIGAPVTITTLDGKRTPSGIVVYAARDLSAVQDQVDGLVRGAATNTLAVLPLAVLLALLASRSVLRPVTRLRRTAQRLAQGDLAARTEPAGVDELARLTRTVNDMAAALQESMDSMARLEEGARRFAADVSHELRTPLTTLTAAVEVLHDVLTHTTFSGSSDQEAARESAQLAVIETRRLMGLVEDIIEIARFDAGTAHPRWEETDLVEVIDTCVRTRGWSDEVVITPAASGRGDGTVVADRRRIDVIMANLIGNALEHGGVPVRVVITTTDEGASARVIDSGPGIGEDVLPHVFSRFYKADAARARTPGSGLGLAIARENALLHDGMITAANHSDGGAVFTLRLPRVPKRATRVAADEEEYA